MPLTNLARRAKKHGWFYETHDSVKEVLVELSEILELRTRMTTIISRHIMAMENIRTANNDKLADLERKIDQRADWLKDNGAALLWVKELSGENERARQARESGQRQQ